MAKNRNPVMSPQQVSHQPPTVVFRVCPMFEKSVKQYSNDAGILKQFKDFIQTKMADPTMNFGSKDYPFTGNNILSGYRHAGLSRDISIVYKISGRNPCVIDLYAIASHQDLGTGTPSNQNKIAANKKSMDRQEFVPDNRFI